MNNMLNAIWLGLMVLSVVFGVIDHRIPEVVMAVTESAKTAFNLALGLAGIMIFWMGLLAIAEKSGLIQVVARILRPIMIRLFPEVPPEHPAMGSMIFNISANMLGVSNAATPFGIRAMEELATLNRVKDTASNAMCTFLAINTSSVQLIPTSAIAMLAANGATHPTAIVLTTLLATCCSTIAGVTAVKWLARLPYFAMPKVEMLQEEKA